MTTEIQKLHDVWFSANNKAIENTHLPKISFDDLTNSVISIGSFYYYIIDFYDMSLSNVSPAIAEIHGFDPETVVFNDILQAIHPDDVDFVVKAEAAVADFFHKDLSRDKLLTYKMNYSFRSRMKNGDYALINHQALMLTLDSNGGYGKALNIHTRIDHLSNHNTYSFSLIGLNNEPSYMNLKCDSDIQNTPKFSKREIDIIKYVAEGLNNQEIGEKLFISALTVKKHRNNILNKSACKNAAQLIKLCVLQGLI
jgi:DNA-binding CsgD family transcriptional regulator